MKGDNMGENKDKKESAMRTILIVIKTDDKSDLSTLKRDLQQEINCCTASFDVDHMKLVEIRKGTICTM
jgi:hypothetical protein